MGTSQIRKHFTLNIDAVIQEVKLHGFKEPADDFRNPNPDKDHNFEFRMMIVIIYGSHNHTVSAQKIKRGTGLSTLKDVEAMIEKCRQYGLIESYHWNFENI